MEPQVVEQDVLAQVCQPLSLEQVKRQLGKFAKVVPTWEQTSSKKVIFSDTSIPCYAIVVAGGKDTGLSWHLSIGKSNLVCDIQSLSLKLCIPVCRSRFHFQGGVLKVYFNCVWNLNGFCLPSLQTPRK